MDNPTLLADLRHLLAELYPDEASARRLIDDAGLTVLRIRLNDSALNNWHAILSEAIKSDQIDALLARVSHEYPNQPRLRNIWVAYQSAQDVGQAGAPKPAMRTAGLASPLPPARFFGRDADLAALTDRLARGECVVLWGLAGMGKSALAVAVLDQPALAAAFPQGRIGLALGPNADAFTLLGTALQSLGVEPTGLATVSARSDQVRALLAQRRLFWLLDDVWSIDQVQPLLAACSRTTGLLLTTRLPLLADELGLTAYPLTPLAPDPAHAMLAASGTAAAQAVAADPATVDQLLTYLGRLPLALHVVGRRLNQLAHADGPAHAGAALYQTLLTKGATLLRLRATAPRLGLTDAQPELAAALALSYDALPDDTVRRAFCQLAAFGAEPRDFDTAAMHAVWGADSEQGLAWRLALTEAGLLTRKNTLAGAVRYSLHQLLYTFAEERLATTPTAVQTTALAHARYYGALVAQWDELIDAQQMTYSEPQEWVQTTAAFEWLAMQVIAPSASVPNAAGAAADAAAVLLRCAQHWRNVIYNNHDPRRMRWLQAAEQAAIHYGASWDLANVQQAQGDVLAFLDQREAALAKYASALTLFEQVGSSLGQANVQKAQGDVLAFLDQREAALAKYASALTLFEQVGDRLGQANALLAMGDLKRSAEDYPAAWTNYEQAQARYTAIGHSYSMARVLYRMGDWQAEQANPTAAADLYRQAIALWEASGLSDLAAQIIAPRLARIVD